MSARRARGQPASPLGPRPRRPPSAQHPARPTAARHRQRRRRDPPEPVRRCPVSMSGWVDRILTSSWRLMEVEGSRSRRPCRISRAALYIAASSSSATARNSPRRSLNQLATSDQRHSRYRLRGLRERDTDPCVGTAKTQGSRLPDSWARTSWPGSGARSTPTKRAGRRLSPRSACWPSPAAAGAKRSICAGATSAGTLSISATRRPAPAPCRSAKSHGRSSPRCRGQTETYLFPRYAEGQEAYSLATCCRTFCADAKLGNLRRHDLRHTAVSQTVT